MDRDALVQKCSEIANVPNRFRVLSGGGFSAAGRAGRRLYSLKFADVTRDAICAGLLIVIIVADVLVFKKLRKYLFRRQDSSDLVGDGLGVLSRIQSMLDEDWDKLRSHYLELGPLFSFTSVHSIGAAADLFGSEQQASSDDTATSPAETWTPPARSSSSRRSDLRQRGSGSARRADEQPDLRQPANARSGRRECC